MYYKGPEPEDLETFKITCRKTLYRHLRDLITAENSSVRGKDIAGTIWFSHDPAYLFPYGREYPIGNYRKPHGYKRCRWEDNCSAPMVNGFCGIDYESRI
jgi:hypothetical protein